MDYCKERELISAYLDGELSSVEKPGFLEHLAACPDCRRETDELRLVRTVLRGAKRRPMPADLKSQLDRRFGASSVFGSIKSWFRLPGVMAI